jgi:hypothetical protein
MPPKRSDVDRRQRDEASEDAGLGDRRRGREPLGLRRCFDGAFAIDPRRLWQLYDDVT